MPIQKNQQQEQTNAHREQSATTLIGSFAFIYYKIIKQYYILY